MTRQQIKAKMAHLSDKIKEDKEELERDTKELLELQELLKGDNYVRCSTS